MDEITCFYLTRVDVDSPQYKEFLETYHGQGTYAEWRERILWYFALGEDNYRILVAKKGDEFVGQSCAYSVDVSMCQNTFRLWWSVDTFVLPKMRGKGIGKLLQGRLHKDLPNFSSAWYSPTNGVIKRKCGAHGLLNLFFGYYPVSSYFTIIFELALKRIISRKIVIPRLRLPFIYERLNSLKGVRFQSYKVEEIPIEVLPSLSGFIESMS